MLYHVVIGISPTQKTLCEGEFARDFTPKSTEYIIVDLDDNLKQVGYPDYGYKSKRAAERLAAQLNRRRQLGARTCN